MAGQEPTPNMAIMITVGTAIPGVFGFFVPAVLDVARGEHDRDLVRLQQAKASTASLVLGAVGSAVTKTPWPFLLSVGLVALLMWEFEVAHRRSAAAS